MQNGPGQLPPAGKLAHGVDHIASAGAPWQRHSHKHTSDKGTDVSGAGGVE